MADACEMVMGNSKAIERLAKEKPGLAKRIADWLHEFFSDIRKAFEGVEARHEEAKAMLDYMDELTKLWDDALVEAAENRVQTITTETVGKRSNRDNPYDGKSLYKDSDVYDYSFMVNLHDMDVKTMPPLSDVKTGSHVDQDKAVKLGLENAASIGRKVSDDVYAIKNAYTGREILLGKHGLDHGLDGDNIGRIRTNARLSAIGGIIVKNAIPVNGLKSKNRQAEGTYAMACLLNSGDRDVVAIVTVEEHTSKTLGIDYVDITHSINGRLKKKTKAACLPQGKRDTDKSRLPTQLPTKLVYLIFLKLSMKLTEVFCLKMFWNI